MVALSRLPHFSPLELLAVMSSCSDEDEAMDGAVERAAQSLEAEVAAIVLDDRVVACIGFPATMNADADVLAVARRERDTLDVPGIGRCPAVGAEWSGAHRGQLVVARAGDGFSIEERGVIAGMARLLSFAVTMLRTVQAEHAMRERSERDAAEKAALLECLRRRELLQEHMFHIQRAISRRRPLPQVLDMITAATLDLLGDEVVGLWLYDTPDTERVRLVSSVGLDIDADLNGPAVPLADAGAASAAMLADDVVVQSGHRHTSDLISGLTGERLRTSIAAPVHDNGIVTGGLLVGSYREDRAYIPSEVQTIRSFAEQVSLALTDANTVDRMSHAFRDSLTGLASRGLFLERLRQRLAGGDGGGPARVALLFLDLDRFKIVNDRLGHAAGDSLLVITANRLTSQLRESDMAARFGGDEFVIMLSGVSTTTVAAGVAQRILRVLDEPMTIAGQQLQVGASIGVAVHSPDVTDPADLIRRADIAMYQAKRNGRCGYRIFSEDMQSAAAPSIID